MNFCFFIFLDISWFSFFKGGVHSGLFISFVFFISVMPVVFYKERFIF